MASSLKENSYYELESNAVEKTMQDIFAKQMSINDLTIIGAALEDAFELINNDSTASNIAN